MHVRPVWCWPACVLSVYGHVVAAAVVLLVCGRVSRLLVGLTGHGSLALQRALAQSDLLRAGALLVSVLVGASCVGPARYVLSVRRPPTVGEKSNDKWFDRCKKFFKFGAISPAPPWQHYMHNPSSGTSRCSVAVLPASPVPFICTSPVAGKAPSVPLSASPCSPWESQGAVPAPWCGARARVCLPAVPRIVPCFAGHVAGVPVSQCLIWRLGLLGRLGSCFGAGTFRPAWWAGLGVTHPCLLAGGWRGPLWRACGQLYQYERSQPTLTNYTTLHLDQPRRN